MILSILAIKKNLFEAIIRTNLQEIFKTNKIKLVIGETQIKRLFIYSSGFSSMPICSSVQ